MPLPTLHSVTERDISPELVWTKVLLSQRFNSRYKTSQRTHQLRGISGARSRSMDNRFLIGPLRFLMAQ